MRDSLVSDISLCSYSHSENYLNCVYMDKRAGLVVEISLERSEMPLTRMKIFPYKYSQTNWISCKD